MPIQSYSFVGIIEAHFLPTKKDGTDVTVYLVWYFYMVHTVTKSNQSTAGQTDQISEFLRLPEVQVQGREGLKECKTYIFS